jgi:hypothetical protein
MSESEEFTEQKQQEDIEDENTLFYPQKLFIIASFLILLIALMLFFDGFVYNAYSAVNIKEFAKT